MHPFKPSKKYWGAYNGLYGAIPKKEVEEEGSGEKSSHKSNLEELRAFPTEQQEQFRVVAWIHRQNLIVHHSPNGGYRDYREGAKFKRLGVSAGYPDLHLPYARKGFHGLFIELKRVKGGRLSDPQIFWRDFLMKEGYAWYEAKGADECINIIQDYLDLQK